MCKTGKIVISFLTATCLCLTLLLGGVLHMARSEKTYTQGFERFADTRASGVERAEYPAIGQALAAFFQGKSDTAQVEVPKFGQAAPAFSEKELQHLFDLKALFGRLEALRIALAAVTAALLIWLYRARAFSLLGMGLTLLLPLPVILWAAVDFNSLLYCLHLVLFPGNDLWLLDPRTDLLIQLMPLELFVYLALKLLLYLLPALLLLLAGIVLRRKNNELR